ncbi:hypothetical protein OH797_32060 [Streptomyces anulatus]|uniref:hypothetical protein n=1 Tax=Streptomyces anulatus TaxID=1892 RepID=UPI00386DD759
MNENESNEDTPFGIFDELETQFSAALLEKRGVYAVAIAGVAGAVYRSAVSEGVPADLAKAFAAEYWDREMNPPAAATALFELDEDEE